MWLIIPVVFHFLLSFSFPFIYWPEMFTYPYFLSHGWLPYQDWSMVYTPILPYLLKIVYETLGYTPFAHHLFSTGIGALTVFLVSLFLFEKTGHRLRAVFAGIFLSVFLLAFGGNAVWFDIFLAPIILLLFLSLISKRFLLAGFFFGVAVLTKQTSFYLLPPVLFFLFREKSHKNFFRFFLPVAVLLSLFTLYLYANNLFPAFYKWGIKFVFLLPFFRNESGTLTPDLLLPTIKQLLAIIPFVIAAIFTIRGFPLLFLAFTCLFAFPRFDFFHLIPALVLTTYFLSRKHWYLLPLLFILVIPLFLKNYSIGQRFLDTQNLETAKIVNDSFAKSSVYSLNGPELIYYLTDKMPAVRPWLDPLPWQMEYDQKEFNANFTRAKPDLVLTKPYLDKSQALDGLGAYKPQVVIDFVQNHYHIAKIVGDVSFWVPNR